MAGPPRDEPASVRILSTLNEDGSRRWLRPKTSKGRFLTARRIVAYALIALFAALPYIKINGRPSVLIDIAHREFTFFGRTFLPTDTLLLALLVVTIFVAIFALTALFGRVWCGWACPQTVYLEFVYRPVEYLFEGGPGRKARLPLPAGVRKPLKFAVFLVISLFLAHVFLAYFVGVETLAQWVRRSPFEHPTSFLVMAFTTGLMMFDFCFFREQTCIVACPYGRFQSVMLDRNSLIISYDENRGEPRGKMRRNKKTGDVSLPTVESEPGDCIDCNLCVTTCPTGIDIRNGLQMECVGCAQCIDACDAVMDKIGRERGLIRYSTQAAMAGEKNHIARPRLFAYSAVLAILVTSFSVVLASKADADVTILRGPGLPFVALDTDEISNLLRFKLVNRTREPAVYTIEPLGPEGLRFVDENEGVRIELGPGATTERQIRVATPRSVFVDGMSDGRFRVTDGAGFDSTVTYRLLGPRSAPAEDSAGGDS